MSGSILVVTFDTATGIRTGKLVGSTLLEDGAVLSGKIGSGQVASGHLTAALIASIEAGVADEGVTSAKLASGAVIGDRIADVGIFSGKIASGAIGPSTLLANAIITSAKLTSAIIGLLGTVADGAITSAKIGVLAVGTPHIAALAIVSGKVASGGLSPLTSGKIWAGFTGNIAREENKPAAGSKVIWKDASTGVMTDLNRTVSLLFTALDLTAFTSPNAKFAILNLRIRADTVGSGFGSHLTVRKTGTTPGTTPRIVLDKAGTTPAYYHYTQVIVALNSAQTMDYSIIVGTGWQVDTRIDVLGYIE